MIDKVEEGKKYRLINKEGYLNSGGNARYNADLIKRGIFDSDGCVVIDKVNGLKCGLVNSDIVISRREFPFFELVEENTENEEPKVITPETEVTITTTYGELAKVYYILGKLNGMDRGASLWHLVRRLLGDEDQVIYDAHRSKAEIIDYLSVQKEWESLFFKSKEQQEKELAIKQKRDMIEKLEKEIKELEGE